jgi:hypothetical protein
MNTLYQIFQGALGGLVAFFFATLMLDAGLSAFNEITLLVVIGATILAALWFLYKRVVGIEGKTHDKTLNTLPIKVGFGFFCFASIVAVGVYE